MTIPRIHHLLLGVLLLPQLYACSGGYAGRTAHLRTLLDYHDVDGARQEAERLVLEAETNNQKDDVDSDYPLLLLERAAVYQAVGDHKRSVSDFADADQMLEVLDLTPEGIEQVARYLFSDDAVLYRPPIYEKLMVNVMEMSSYLAMGDFNGAQVEARRINVLAEYFENTDLAQHQMLGAAYYMAGLAMEASGNQGDALRFYIDAYRIGDAPELAENIVRLSRGTVLENRAEVLRARQQLGLNPEEPAPQKPAQEVVVIVYSGLAPRREAERFPIGVVLEWVGPTYVYSDEQRAFLDRDDAEALLTWINFPVLVKLEHSFTGFDVAVDGRHRDEVILLADVESFALDQWKQQRAGIAFAAITRALTRVIAREAIQATGKNSTEVFIASLIVQGGLQAADTPDTRTWTAMPAHIWIARIPVDSGPQTVEISSYGGFTQTLTFDVDVPRGGVSVVTARFF